MGPWSPQSGRSTELKLGRRGCWGRSPAPLFSAACAQQVASPGLPRRASWGVRRRGRAGSGLPGRRHSFSQNMARAWGGRQPGLSACPALGLGAQGATRDMPLVYDPPAGSRAALSRFSMTLWCPEPAASQVRATACSSWCRGRALGRPGAAGVRACAPPKPRLGWAPGRAQVATSSRDPCSPLALFCRLEEGSQTEVGSL